MRKLVHFVYSSVALAHLASGQNQPINGTVVDPSGRPVASARIECGNQRLSTDDQGRFSIPGVERCEALISASGLAPKRTLVVGGTENKVALDLAALAESVLVSATRTPATLEESGVAAGILTRQQIEQRQFPMLLELLRAMPGLDISQTSRQGGLTEVYTRGAQRTGTLFLLDGVPLNDPGGELDLAHLATTDLDRVEVVRGPESALFGSEASAGVIQLFTRRGASETAVPHGSFSYERRSFNTDRWVGGLNGALGDRFDYSLTADQLHTVGEYPNDFYRNTTGSANLGFRLAPSTQIRGIFREFDTIGGTPGQVSYGAVDYSAFEANRDSTVAVKLDDARGRNYLQNVSFGYHRSRIFFDDSAVGGPYDLAALLRDAPGNRVYLVSLLDPLHLPATVPGGERIATASVFLYPFSSTSEISRSDFEYQGTLTHASGALVFGYAYERQAGLISASNVHRNNHGLFVHKQQSIGRRLSLSAGARLEQNTTFGTKFTPRAAASFRLFSSTLLRASAGRGITDPSLIENYTHDSFSIGNPNLKPERTTSFDGGIVQELFGRRIRAEAAYFRSSFHDLIAFVFDTFPASWRNIEASYARGVETSVQARFLRYVTASASYTRLYTRVTASRTPDSPLIGIGQELLKRPRNRGSVSVAVAPRRWSFIAGGNFVGERQDSDFVFGLTRNPGYQNVYASGTYQATRRLAPFIRGDNLLNSRYQEVLGFASLSRTIVGGVRVFW